MVKCKHESTTVLYAQRRQDGKRKFVAEARKCNFCQALLPPAFAIGAERGP